MIEIPDDEQLVFDTVAKHLLTQGKKSLGISGNCLYRNEQGLKCAAGCLIPEEQYNVYMEGSTWSDLVLKEHVSNHCHKLIDMLQYLHDFESPSIWLSLLHKLAKDQNLDTSKLPLLT
jgi:hypothetical protein